MVRMFCNTPQTVQMGRFGLVSLQPGYYLYSGSALGPGGLRARLGHHLRTALNPHWHLDYLRRCLPVDEIWWSVAQERYECRWAMLMTAWRGARFPWPGFGASDCNCSSHLVLLSYRPSRRTFQRRLRALDPKAPKVYSQTINDKPDT